MRESVVSHSGEQLSVPAEDDFCVAHGTHAVSTVERCLAERADVVFLTRTGTTRTDGIGKSHFVSPIHRFMLHGYYYDPVNV